MGSDAQKTVESAVTLEAVAQMAINTVTINPDAKHERYLFDKQYFRKHGKNAYYG